MKKSIFLVMGVCILCVSVMFPSCDNDTSTGGNGGEDGDAAHPSSLIGLWNLISAIDYGIITTNSNQTAIDLESEGTGAINVTGSENATLKYVAAQDSSGVIQGVASNVPLTEFLDLSDLKIREQIKNPDLAISKLKTALTYPLYVLYFSSAEGAMFQAMQSEITGSIYFGTIDGLSFDMATYTLTATNATLYGFGYDYTAVLINGQLQGNVMNVPANTPTVVMTQDFSDMMTIALNINADGTYMNISDYGLGLLDTTNGTWEVTGGNNLMTVDYHIENGDTVETDTSYSTYELNGNNLVITWENDACAGEQNIEECMAGIETELGIDEGSLVSAIEQMDMTFSKANLAKL